jgi:hypothetical protein
MNTLALLVAVLTVVLTVVTTLITIVTVKQYNVVIHFQGNTFLRG